MALDRRKFGMPPVPILLFVFLRMHLLDANRLIPQDALDVLETIFAITGIIWFFHYLYDVFSTRPKMSILIHPDDWLQKPDPESGEIVKSDTVTFDILIFCSQGKEKVLLVAGEVILKEGRGVRVVGFPFDAIPRAITAEKLMFQFKGGPIPRKRMGTGFIVGYALHTFAGDYYYSPGLKRRYKVRLWIANRWRKIAKKQKTEFYI